ncbi:MAG: GNAT family N-acetyltransferase [Acutalibacteraceae bacterium]
MEFVEIKTEQFDDLKILQKNYKAAIGEDEPDEAQLESLKKAIEQGNIHFYGCILEDLLVACCSVCITYSTFDYGKSGVFEDFYILPEYRHKGIARKLVAYAYEQSKVSSLTVGCADCDVEMYRAIGFQIPLGNMMAFGEI